MKGTPLRLMIVAGALTLAALAVALLSNSDAAFLDEFNPRPVSPAREAMLVERLLGSGQFHGKVRVLEFEQDQQIEVYQALRSRLTSYGVNKYYFGRPVQKLPSGYEIFTNRGGSAREVFAFACNESGAQIRQLARTGSPQPCDRSAKTCVVVYIPTQSWLDSHVQDVGSFLGL